jgi:hypothetical protein
MTTKTQHKAEIYDAACIARAERFICSVFLGRGKYDKRDAATRDEAQSIAAVMAAEHRSDAIVYAIYDGNVSVIADTVRYRR